MAGDLRQKRGAKSQRSMYEDESGGGSEQAAPGQPDRRPEWARDSEPQGAMVTEEEAQKFRGFRLETIGEAFRLAAACVEGKMVPKGMTEGGVVAIWQRGFESGMQPMEALENLFVINGKPGMYANKMAARARQHGAFAPGGDPALTWVVGAEEMPEDWNPVDAYKTLDDWPNDLKAVVTAVSASNPDKEIARSFSVAEAKQAKKWKCDTDSPWVKYPARQLRARALSFLMRDEFDEFTGGFTPLEELRDIEPREERDITESARPAPEGRDPALDAREPDAIEKPDGSKA